MAHEGVGAPRSFVWETDLDLLGPDPEIERRNGFLLVRLPDHPTDISGNFLLFDHEPRPGDAARWEELFDKAFANVASVRHRRFGWDRTDGATGAARAEFVSRGYELEESFGLTAKRLEPHPRENREVVVRELDPAAGADDELWSAVVELLVPGRGQADNEQSHCALSRSRVEERRARFREQGGAWYVALEPAASRVVGSCAVAVTAGRGHIHSVHTAPARRREGICSRLVVEASRRAAAHRGAERFVIVADAGYHALGLYESLGFERREHVFAVCRRPSGDETGAPVALTQP